MTPTKQILNQMQEQEKKNQQDIVVAFSEQNFNLNLCKTFLSKLIESHLTPVELKRTIKDFLQTLNEK